MVKLKRAYDKAEAGDGPRYLVDRLWPRGVTKASLQIEGWLKNAAPSEELRNWFHHEPQKWNEFRQRYFGELRANPDAWAALAGAAGKTSITLVYGAKDPEHNNAVALAEFLNARGAPKARKKPSGRAAS